MNEHLESIRNNLQNITQEEYQKYGYIPSKTEAKQLKSNIKEKEAEIQVNKMKGEINKMIRKKEFKKSTFNEPTENVSFIMDNTSNMFNIVDKDVAYPDWRSLSNEDKLKVLDEFFEMENTGYEIPFNDTIKDELRELINQKKLLYKKDIIYDKINRKILSIPLLKCEKGIFILKEDVKKVNVKKSNLSNINKLLKQN
jgi:hypothetical protein